MDGGRKSVRLMIAPRTISSVLRTAIYGAVAGLFALSNAEAGKLIDAALVGAILGDYVTWLIRSLMLLPSDIWHGCYDALFNILVGWFMFHMCRIQPTSDGETIGVAFASFMAVMLVKLLYYGVSLVTASDDDE